MEITYTKFKILEEKGVAIDQHNTVLIAEEPLSGWPQLTGSLRLAYENERDRTEIIKTGIRNFSFLLPDFMLCRLCLLGELIKKHTTDKKAIFIANLLLLVGDEYSPVLKTPDSVRFI